MTTTCCGRFTFFVLQYEDKPFQRPAATELLLYHFFRVLFQKANEDKRNQKREGEIEAKSRLTNTPE